MWRLINKTRIKTCRLNHLVINWKYQINLNSSNKLQEIETIEEKSVKHILPTSRTNNNGINNDYLQQLKENFINNH